MRSETLQKLVYATVLLLALGLVGMCIVAIYGFEDPEQRFTVDSIFYVSLLLGAIGFAGIAGIFYYRFKQRNRIRQG